MKVQHDKVWFTSDLHFWHKNICKYCNRPFNAVEEMNEALVTNWNSVVKDDDVVFILGDLGFCGYEKLAPYIARLKGKKYLVQGNHDSDKIVAKLWEADLIEEYYKLTTITVEGDPEIPSQVLTLCHFPMIDWYDKERGAWMVHGHQHQLPGTPSCSVMHWDVGVDKNNLTPISFEQLKVNITTQFVKRNEDCSNQ